MHVAVFADLEGAFGVWRQRQCHTGTPEWQYGRECLTADVNAVVRGAFDGGATRVTVKDTHATGFNCLVPRLDPRAGYVGGHYVTPTFFGNVEVYDLVLYVAIHAASGTPDAFFPHTHYGVFSEVRCNGRAICEMELYGAYLGEYGVPVGFVSGEAVAVRQAREVLPWALGVNVDKRRESYTAGVESARLLTEGRAELQATAARAVREIQRMCPLRLTGGFHLEAVFRTEALANRFNTWDLDQQGACVSWFAADMREAFETFNRLTFFPRRIYPVRAQVLFLMRQIYRVRSRLLAPRPNREGAA